MAPASPFVRPRARGRGRRAARAPRRGGALRPVAPAVDLEREGFDDLAIEAADDAALAILDRLDEFRGESRFTTWAWKFGFYAASVAVRKRRWLGREVPSEDAGWAALSAEASPDGRLSTTVCPERRPFLLRHALGLVEAFDLGREMPGDRSAAELQRLCHLTRLDGEVAREDREALDLLEPRAVTVHALDD